MNTNTSTPMDTRISTTTNILTRTKNTAMNIPTRMIMNTRISIVMNMIIKGKPMSTIMSTRANTDLTSISTPDMKKRFTCTKI